MQPRNVQVSRSGLQQGGVNRLGPQDWRPHPGAFPAQSPQGGGVAVLVREVVQAPHLIGARDMQHRTRAQQTPGEAPRRVLEEVSARGGERLYRRTAIGGDVHRCGTPGGVVADLRLPLHQGHP